MSSKEKRLWVTGAALMSLAIILGAFGAHALRESVPERALEWWETGAAYHRAHALGVLLLAALYPRISPRGQRRIYIAALMMVSGIFFFSGSLYVMTLTQLRVLGAITPIGGTLWIISWLICAWSMIAESSSQETPLGTDLKIKL